MISAPQMPARSRAQRNSAGFTSTRALVAFAMIASAALLHKAAHPGRKIVGVLPQLVEQSCVLDSEDTLLGEVASDLNPADAARGTQTR